MENAQIIDLVKKVSEERDETAFSELFGGIMIMLGIYVRYFSSLLFITMFIATCSHLSSGDGIMGASHAIESAIVFLFFILSGSTVPPPHTLNDGGAFG